MVKKDTKGSGFFSRESNKKGHLGLMLIGLWYFVLGLLMIIAGVFATTLLAYITGVTGDIDALAGTVCTAVLVVIGVINVIVAMALFKEKIKLSASLA